MQFKSPKDDSKFKWTNHVQDKMRYYGISESLIKRVIRFPDRIEEGIAERTTASMKPNKITERLNGKATKWKEEIWVMWQEVEEKSKLLAQRAVSVGRQGSAYGRKNQKLQNHINPQIMKSSTKKKIISTWRYPAMSPLGKEIPIPDEILQEIDDMIESEG